MGSLQPPDLAPRQSTEHWLHSHEVRLQVGDSVLGMTRPGVGNGSNPKQSPAFLSHTLWVFFSGCSAPSTRDRQVVPAPQSLSLLSPCVEVPQLTKCGMGTAGGKVVHCLADRLAGCKYWPLIVLALLWGGIVLFCFLTSFTKDSDSCSHPPADSQIEQPAGYGEAVSQVRREDMGPFPSKTLTLSMRSQNKRGAAVWPTSSLSEGAPETF